jgi:mannosyl-oligosaccharide glucosidase
LLIYFGFDGNGSLALRNTDFLKDYTKPVILDGWKQQLGNYTIMMIQCAFSVEVLTGKAKNNKPIKPYKEDEDDAMLSNPAVPHFLANKLPPKSLWRIKDALTGPLFYAARSIIEERGEDRAFPHPAQLFALKDHAPSDSNMQLVQFQLQAPFELDMVFMSQSARPKITGPIPAEEALKHSGESLTRQLDEAAKRFDERFEETFGLHKKGYKTNHVKFAKSALSQLIGGMGFFHGDSKVARTDSQGAPLPPDDDEPIEESSDETEKKVEVDMDPPTSLFTATPSRPFFPRGFLWDEGFHQLLISTWDESITAQVIHSWLRLMDKDGWIAREQILGEEARSKVPEEFQVQHRHYANPPTLLLPVLRLVGQLEKAEKKQSILAYTPDSAPTWLSTNPAAGIEYLQIVYQKLKLNYEWFRRTQSGSMDKFGRKGYVGYRWRGRTQNHTLTSGFDDYPRADPSDTELHLDLLCWMSFYARGLGRVAKLLEHWDDAELLHKQHLDLQRTLNDLHFDASTRIWHDLVDDTHVRHLGYVSLMPLALQLIDADSDTLGVLIKHMRNTEELGSRYGLLSLSRSDAFYGQGENYWRGNIWVNVNFLIINALQHVRMHFLGLGLMSSSIQR